MIETHHSLHADHADLRKLVEQLRDAVESTEPRVIQQAWTELESRLLAHLEGEERYLLPPLEETHRADVVRLRKEHDRIRAALSTLGVQADLHALRKTAADALLSELTAHAAREDETLYRWAESEVSEGAQRSLLDVLKRARGRFGSP
jgi:iron-sulfur cluster repair protein YtfE (RIC family)